MTRVPLTAMRRAIGAAMVRSAAIPQFTLERSARVGGLLDVRRRLREEGLDASLSDVLTAACARALRAHPPVNASWDDDAIVLHDDVHVGLAVALPGGVVSPGILHADRRSLPELASERVRLVEAARTGRLSRAELLAPTFTISNLGPYGVERFQALVVPPQAAIVAVGAVADSRLALSLSCDHRVLDGAPAAEFLATIVGALERADWVEEVAGASH